jgi:GT2 family glycosyltransferase/glycosyltransferase involved in cell wall biosynthesis
MSISANKSQLSLANAAMRAKDYKAAIELYEKAVLDSPEMHEQISFNLRLAKKHLERCTLLAVASAPIGTQPETDKGVQNFSYRLAVSSETLPDNIKSNLDVVDENFIHGWVYDTTLNEALELDLIIDNVKIKTVTANILREDVFAAGGPRVTCGFKLEHGSITRLRPHAQIKVKLSGSERLAFNQTIETSVISAEIEHLSEVAQYVKRALTSSNSSALNWISSVAIPELMEKLRQSAIPPASHALPLSKPSSERPVDVIIPVYEGLEETINCIDSVLSSINTAPFNLIVINDCSPNKKLSGKLQAHARKHNYSLIVNEKNLGFVGTVNKGMRSSKDNDVILLNSDTLVPNGWIDQLSNAAYTDPIIGTVTPFSNNATICSFPSFCQDNVLPSHQDVASLNKIFNMVNSGAIIDLPTAHGFCMYIKRTVLNEIGFFDELKWGKGYAEENDFSIRAEQRGWRNVMALDTFVQHLGSVSFASNTDEFIRKNLKILHGLYPDYSAKVAKFIHLDPARAYRNEVARYLLADARDTKRKFEKSDTSMLFVTLTIGGGTQIATDEISRFLEREGSRVFCMTCPTAEIWRLSHTFTGVHVDYRIDSEMDLLLSDLESINISHVNFHNTIEFGKDVWDLPKKLSCGYDVTIHDYLSVCPRVNLIGSNSKYCGEPSVEICNKCVAKSGEHESSFLKIKDFNHDVKLWRLYYLEKLASARRVFVPSMDVATRLQKYFSGVNFLYRPHPEPVKTVKLLGPSKDGIANIAFLGAIGAHKGYDYLIGCATYALKNKLPLMFHVIGYTKDDDLASKLSNIIIHGKYTRNELPKLLKASKCNVAAVLSVWPETFSYTFSEALDAGLKVITFDLGAPAERLPPGAGTLVSLDDSFGKICEEMIELSQKPGIKINTGKRYSNHLIEYFGFDQQQPLLSAQQ